MPEEERAKIWDDGLHFTTEGYERLGNLLAKKLVQILKGEDEE